MSSSQRPQVRSLVQMLAEFRERNSVSTRFDTEKASRDLQIKIADLEKDICVLKKDQHRKSQAASHVEFITPRKRVRTSEGDVASTQLKTMMTSLRKPFSDSRCSVGTNVFLLNKLAVKPKTQTQQQKGWSSTSVKRSFGADYGLSSSSKPLVPILPAGDSKKLLFF